MSENGKRLCALYCRVGGVSEMDREMLEHQCWTLQDFALKQDFEVAGIFHAEDLPDVLTMAHVAMFLGCSVSKAYGLLKLEGFPHTVLLHRVYVDKKKFLAWIDEQIQKKW